MQASDTADVIGEGGMVAQRVYIEQAGKLRWPLHGLAHIHQAPAVNAGVAQVGGGGQQGLLQVIGSEVGESFLYQGSATATCGEAMEVPLKAI